MEMWSFNERILSLLVQLKSLSVCTRQINWPICHGVCRYVDRLTANLHKLTNDADKMMSLSRLMSTRHTEAVDEQRQLEPQLDLLRQRTKELQTQVYVHYVHDVLTI